ncbi:MAG: NAD-dependent epimerase/dehydratase family protein, partial [Caldilineaceae bacterium]|nr:NAD-dependent epimerase/dehydratase family protein [Caldilineaceae bacterium]
MKLLVLGGTQFVGRHITQTALDRGHTITLFNRGRSNPELFPQAEKLVGDRGSDLSALHGRRWDAVIDVNGYVPRHVREAATLLADVVDQYTFISTISVYARMDVSDQDESAPLATTDTPETEEVTGETYGPLKARCERAAEQAMPGRTLIIRPGFVVGPHDTTDRFTSWLRRIGRGGEMLAAGEPGNPVQFIDGRDLAEFTVRLVEAKAASVYNATGPAALLTWGELFAAASRVCNVETQFTWVSESFLEGQQLNPNDLPMVVPASAQGLMRTNIDKALAAGLSFRPLAQTISDTLAWDAQEGTPKVGLSPEREAELLQA